MRNNVEVSQGTEGDEQGREGTNKEKSTAEDEGPACQSCRKKKAKCTRRQPCSHCVRFNIDCIYDDRRNKPGLRTGAVENLTQRVVALENMFMGQGILWQQVWNCISTIQTQSSHSKDLTPPASTNGQDSLAECTSQLKNTLSNLASDLEFQDQELAHNPLKRRRTESATEKEQPRVSPIQTDKESDLPPDDLMDSLVEIYFANIHPWIPILHVKQFRERMAEKTQRQKLLTVFHAIVSICVRFSNDSRLNDSDIRSSYAKRSKRFVILQSMESFSVENLQALVICAFDTIGSGRGPSAWSIVGSMTRTVEQLQLSVEDEDQPLAEEFLIRRMAFLPPCKSWIEVEERRRVFWNVFLMDRFCSIATGWNFSLTSADVKRRLPCEGALWEEGKPLETPTPYFGVSDKSSGGYLPTRRPELEDQVSIGGFAYCIEASESLSLVTSFFLRHAVKVSNVQDVQMWLMRFKELDLRLIQWKIFLPDQWREACALNANGMLDPNLTLAHITHNTAVGLLHQGIAYPSPEWQSSPIRLPSVSSAETCLAAATEVAIIAEKYLQATTSLTNPQFAFCLFICGRMLLAHSLHYKMPVPLEFESLTKSLKEISWRWNGPHAQSGSANGTENLASKFAARLVQARDYGPHTLDIRQAAYSEEQHNSDRNTSVKDFADLAAEGHEQSSYLIGSSSGISTTLLSAHNKYLGNSDTAVIENQESSPDSISLAFPPLPLAFQPHCTNSTQAVPAFISTPIPHQDSRFPVPGEASFNSVIGFDDAGNAGFDSTGNSFEELNSFFEYPFLPTQRVSMFSEQNGKERGSD